MKTTNIHCPQARGRALERSIAMGPQPEPWRILEAGEQGPTVQRTFGFPVPWRFFRGSLFARHPEIFDAIAGGRRFGGETALNPQPLPPRYAFLASVAQTVAEHAELLQEFADEISHDVEKRGIIIVGGRLRKFCDEWCPVGFRPKWPFPGPPPEWFTGELRGTDLLVIAAQLHESSQEAFSPVLRGQLAEAGERFLEAGLSRIAR